MAEEANLCARAAAFRASRAPGNPFPLPFQTPTTQPSPFRGDLLKAEQLRPHPHEDDCKRKR